MWAAPERGVHACCGTWAMQAKQACRGPAKPSLARLRGTCPCDHRFTHTWRDSLPQQPRGLGAGMHSADSISFMGTTSAVKGSGRSGRRLHRMIIPQQAMEEQACMWETLLGGKGMQSRY